MKGLYLVRKLVHSLACTGLSDPRRGQSPCVIHDIPSCRADRCMDLFADMLPSHWGKSRFHQHPQYLLTCRGSARPPPHEGVLRLGARVHAAVAGFPPTDLHPRRRPHLPPPLRAINAHRPRQARKASLSYVPNSPPRVTTEEKPPSQGGGGRTPDRVSQVPRHMPFRHPRPPMGGTCSGGRVLRAFFPISLVCSGGETWRGE